MLPTFLAGSITACLLPNDPVEYTKTATQCSGWVCEIDGQIILPAGGKKEQLPVELVIEQISNCSPTRGQQAVPVKADGSFTVDVYVHDTDSFVITGEVEGYAPIRYKFGGFECLYCSCSPIEITLAVE